MEITVKSNHLVVASLFLIVFFAFYRKRSTTTAIIPSLQSVEKLWGLLKRNETSKLETTVDLS